MPDIVYQISCLGSEDKNMDSVKNLSWENQLGLEKKGSINMFRKVRKERRNSVQAYGRKTRQKKTADYGREISHSFRRPNAQANLRGCGKFEYAKKET